MQIVINIDEKIYNEYMNLATGRIPIYKACDIAWVLKNGTVLPKGHGDLIDVSKLNDVEIYDSSNDMYGASSDQIMNAETIIEADKVDCERTNCDNCVNYKYCDYE